MTKNTKLPVNKIGLEVWIWLAGLGFARLFKVACVLHKHLCTFCLSQGRSVQQEKPGVGHFVPGHFVPEKFVPDNSYPT